MDPAIMAGSGGILRDDIAKGCADSGEENDWYKHRHQHDAGDHSIEQVRHPGAARIPHRCWSPKAASAEKPRRWELAAAAG